MSARRAELSCLIAVLALQGAVLALYFSPSVGGADAHGYHAGARLLAATGSLSGRLSDPWRFLGEMWVVTESGETCSKYPPGYPVLIAAATALGGERAGLLLNPLLAVLATLGAWVAARSRGPAWPALVVAWVFSTLPVLGSFAVHQVSHACSVAAVTWSLALFALAVRRSPPSCGLLAAAGLLGGYAATVRYADLLLMVPMAAWFALRRPPPWRAAMAWGAGLSLPLGMLATYDSWVFGAPWRTGYALTGEQAGFAWEHLRHNLGYYLRALWSHGAGPAALLALLALALLARRRPARAGFWALWIVPPLLLHASYYWAPEQRPIAVIRFLLPTMVPIAILAVWCLHAVQRRFGGRAATAAVAAFLVAQGVFCWPLLLSELESRFGGMDLERRKAAFVRSHVPAGVALFTDVTMLHVLDVWHDHELYDEQILHRGRWIDHVGALLARQPCHIQRARLEQWYRALRNVDVAGHHARMRSLIARLLARGELYLAVVPGALQDFRREYGEGLTIEPVAVLPPTALRCRLVGSSDAVRAPAVTVVRVRD